MDKDGKIISSGMCGIAILDGTGKLISHHGAASDVRIRALLTDPDWIAEATERRLTVVRLSDGAFSVVASVFEEKRVVILFPEDGETVTKFLLAVDFAFDIIEHLLTDPYDAMAVIDAAAKLVFVSPVHEKFFGLRSGEGVGSKVQDVIENTRLHHVVRTGVAEVGQLQKMKGRERVVSRHPIRHGGKVVGAIGRVMFKGPQQLDALARKVNALEQEIATYKNEAKESSRAEAYLDAIIGRSPAILEVRSQIRKIAPLDIPVLIHGESGTGKELVAMALHMMSPRHAERLVTVNAAALPAQLVESELFGYEAGSFTGADRKGRPGKFEQADKGTIFLDEIGDMPIEMQSKLLRVLQDRMIERIGGEKPKKVDFRLCSATNRNLEDFVNQGKFRLDLFYRISPVVISLPTLSDRVEDIPLLVDHFVRELSKQYNRQAPQIGEGVYEHLMSRPWPGNVRELRHVIERAIVFAENHELTLRSFETTNSAATQGKPTRHPEQGRSGATLKEAIDRLEINLVNEAMLQFNGNKKRVAEHLGVSRSYLYKILGG